MTPIDRRGLAETVAWTGQLVMTGLAFIVAMFKADPVVIHVTMGIFSGSAMALIARGTKGAIDRDAVAARQETPPTSTP